MVSKNKTKYLLNKCCYTSIFIVFFASYYIKSKAIEYIPLVKEDIFGAGTGSTKDLGTFLQQAYNFGIALAIVLAAIMIFIGGVEYMTSYSSDKKSDGLKKINEAAIGLGLALISYLILYTINPSLVDFSGNTIIKP
ncbi:MAG: hypothetical protein WC827_02860 [Candidatus Paceibacterota bacterium]|jgi:glucose uptake protein GlcU